MIVREELIDYDLTLEITLLKCLAQVRDYI